MDLLIFAELLLFLPWRKEEDLHPDNAEKCIALFNQSLDTINRNRKCVFPFSDDVKEISDFLANTEDSRPQHLYDSIDSKTEQENLDDLNELEPLDKADLPSEIQESNLPEQSKYRAIEVESDDDMLKIARSLSPEQMIPFMMVIDFCFKQRIAGSSALANDPPRVIAQGGGGVGSVTYLITKI